MKKIKTYIFLGLACTLLLSACSVRQPVVSDISAPIEEEGSSFVLSGPPAPESSSLVSLMPTATPKPVTATEMSMQAKRASLADLDLSIPTVFAITRPANKLTTTYASYFINGTSNPGLPVLFNGQPLARLGTKGTFGVLVNLAIGTNTFTFEQGGKTITVTIVRQAEASAAAPISVLRQSSLYPAASGTAKAGGEITVECVGPSGASVTASFGGNSVTLQQVALADTGVPAVFRATLPIGTNYNTDVTQKAGKVTYTLSYNGTTTQYESTGNMYVAGQNSNIAIEVIGYAGFVYPDTKALYNIREKLKAGATDYVISDNNEYFQLASGGWIPKAMARVIEGTVSIANRLDSASLTVYSNCEIYYFTGSRAPAYTAWMQDGFFYLRLYNTYGSTQLNAATSRVFSGVDVTTGNSSVTYSFPINNPGLLWGYCVTFDGTTMQLRIRYKPPLGSAEAPLSNVTVLLDPGHGGDPGALGMTGASGPSENIINLAHAFATRDALEALGAKVIMTRESDTAISLDDRLRAIEVADADFFISLHHNSLAENVDANKVAGMEIYYHMNQSQAFAGAMMESLATNVNRSNRGVHQSYYRVTLMPFSPAILCELGYLSNALEYEKTLDRGEIIKVGQAVADGVLRAMQQ